MKPTLAWMEKRRAYLTAQRNALVRRDLAAVIHMGLVVDRFIQEGCEGLSEEEALHLCSADTDVPIEELREALETFRTTPHPYGYAWRQD